MKRFLFPLLLIYGLIFTSQAMATTQPVTITMPATTVRQAIVSMLPLPLEQNSDRFQGKITIDSIRSLTIKNNIARIEGQVSGHNMVVTTNIGGQDIKLKLGRLVLPITCDVRIRFDPKTKTLFFRPTFHNPTHGSSNSAKTLLPLLNGLANREFSAKLSNLSPFQTKIGSKTVSLKMEPVDILTGNNNIVLKLRPIVGKSR